MTTSYAAALATATDPSVKTQWQDELHDIPPVNDRDTPTLKSWICTTGSPVASQALVWDAIKSNWISFLAATCKDPSAVLAPNRQNIRLDGGVETEAQAKRRFQHDRRLRLSVQGAIWRLFDNKEALLEGWPHGPRLMMNRIIESDTQIPLTGFMNDFGKQRRLSSVWTSMICFLLYCYHDHKCLEKMGLDLSQEYEEELLDVEQALILADFPEPDDAGEGNMVEQRIQLFVIAILTDTSADPKTNPLLWWTVVLVRSSIETGSDDFISRGRFMLNILPMDLNLEQRIEGMIHFAKVLLWDFAFATWDAPETQHLEVQADLDAVDKQGTCSSPAWTSLLGHVESTFTEYLQSRGTPMHQIILLQKELAGTDR